MNTALKVNYVYKVKDLFSGEEEMIIIYSLWSLTFTATTVYSKNDLGQSNIDWFLFKP